MKKETIEWIIPEKYRNIEDSKYLNRIVSGKFIKEYKFVLCATIPPKYTYPFEEEYIQNWSGNWIIYLKYKNHKMIVNIYKYKDHCNVYMRKSELSIFLCPRKTFPNIHSAIKQIILGLIRESNNDSI